MTKTEGFNVDNCLLPTFDEFVFIKKYYFGKNAKLVQLNGSDLPSICKGVVPYK